MSEQQHDGRRRSTRSQQPASQPDTSSGGVRGEAGARSRLADGARSRPGTTQSTQSNEPKQQMQSSPSESAKKTATAGASRATASPKNTRGANPNANQKKNSDKKEPDKKKEENSKDGGLGKTPDSSDKKSAPPVPPGDSGSSVAAAGKAAGLGKRPGADATGVDYSDKSMKDQLEHQAADVAMDATPVLGQINSARKALKQANQAKREVTGPKEDDIADKAEDIMDDGVDKGIKGVKIAAGIGAAQTAGSMGMVMMLMINMAMMLKGAVLAAAGKAAGFFTSILSTASSAVSGALGVSAAVGNVVVAGATAVAVTGASVLGFGVVQEAKKDDSMTGCVPALTKVAAASQEYVMDGELDAIRQDHAVKLWSVYSALGSSKEQTAAVLGNLQAESSLDPTSVETIYDEPFAIGSRKQHAISSDFKVGLIDASYAARFPAIEHVGVGLAQWTNGRNRLLINYAKDNGSNWYEFDTQIRFMLDGDDKMRQQQLSSFLKDKPGNVQGETERFMNTWIGLSSPNSSLSARQTNATDYMFMLERATADTDYANSILSGLNVDRSSGNHSAGAYHQDDGCGNPIKSHYGNGAVDGTGEVPAGLTLVPWSRETLPDSLKEFSKNPEDAGLAWGNASGWTNGIIPDQCAALSHSYFILLYPDWNKNGRGSTRPFGDGKDVADLWAKHYGEKAVDYPTAGAVFSDTTTSVYGHTGIVQHVFANGDILINEQNIRGVSGAGAGINYSWSWRVIKKDRYEQASWKFFKPADAEPQWTAK